MPALGDRFREAREARGLTLSEVAEQIRIRSVYLAAIEDENWPAIGAPIYVRGFLRTYARFLALSPEETVAQFNAETSDKEAFEAPSVETSRYTPEGRKNLAPMLWIASIVAVLLIAYVVYGAMNLQNRGSSNQQVSTGPSQIPATVGPTTLSPAPSLSPAASLLDGASPLPAITPGPSTISILASAPTWLRIAVDGKIQYVGILRTGSVQTFRGKTASVRIGNAGGAQITVDGKSLGALGKSGQVIDRTFSL